MGGQSWWECVFSFKFAVSFPKTKDAVEQNLVDTVFTRPVNRMISKFCSSAVETYGDAQK